MNQLYIKTGIIFIICALGITCFSGREGRAANSTKAKNQSQGSAASLLIVASMQDSMARDTKNVNEAEKYKVTFIELGSVRCIPCKKMQPIMEEIKKEYAGQVNVVFHDVWTEKGRPYAQKYKIQAIPTQVFLDGEGNEYFRHEGFFPKEELIRVLKKQGVELKERK